MYYAHSENKNGKKQLMREHAANVAQLAEAFAEPFGGGEEAYIAGLLHDLGKYADRFVKRLEGTEKGLDHWTAGAWVALTRCKCIGAALAIQGHHIGLQRADSYSLKELSQTKPSPNTLELTDGNVDILLKRWQEDGFKLRTPTPFVERKFPKTASAMLDVRMLFSALVDADFLDTSRHFGEETIEAPSLNPNRAMELVEGYLQEVRKIVRARKEVCDVRDTLMHHCRIKAEEAPGLFTLTAPTGAGKTLGMLLFGLAHAKKHGFKRIIFVLPYLSIVEQFVNLFRNIFESAFGPGYVLEHHGFARWQHISESEELSEEVRALERQLSENWRAPIIITTSIQFLESLFSNRPGDCRKLHAVAESVVFFDEVQTLPTELVVPILKTLSRLVTAPYKVTLVFSTATQPAFTQLDAQVKENLNSGWRPQEIAPHNLFQVMRRVETKWMLEHRITPEQLCEIIAKDVRVPILCVVNMRKDARDCALLLREHGVDHVYHLSTSMCPLHRETTLKKVKERLAQGEPCVLISTQCVEAGVDVDFPKGYRALGPLPSLAQVAGRINRNGLLERGHLTIFRFVEERFPDKAYEQASHVTWNVLRSLGDAQIDLEDPSLYERYYSELYQVAPPPTLGKKLQEAIESQNYKEVAELFRLIDEDYIHVLVPYADKMKTFECLAGEVRSKGLSRSWIRRAQPLTVNLYLSPKVLERLEPLPGRGPMAKRWFVCYHPEDYDALVGINLQEGVDPLIA